MLYDSMTSQIGNTPLVKIERMPLPDGVNFYAKLELCNPSGSLKDRTGKYLLDAAEKAGKLKSGSTIILATAGNTGLGLAFAALEHRLRGREYRVIFVVPTKFSAEKQSLMRALGAEVVNTPAEGGMLGAARKAEELTAEIPGAVTFNQFTDPANPLAHYETTGVEIYADLPQVTHVIAGAGSGGTLTGIMQRLREYNPNLKGVLADPAGSLIGDIINERRGIAVSHEHHAYDIEGIGNDFVADTLDDKYVDSIVKVTDTESFEYCRLIAKTNGIFAGTSSGAVTAAAVKFAKDLPRGQVYNIVGIFADRGDRYFSKNLF